MKNTYIIVFFLSMFVNANETTLHPEIWRILSPTVSAYGRLGAIKRLPARLSETDAEQLLLLLASPPKSDTSLKEFDLATIKNDLTGVLGNDPRLTNRLADILIAGAVDSEQGLIWRNYCVQYFPYIYPKCTRDNQSRLDSATLLALRNPNVHIAGTALLAMKKLNFTKDELLTAAWQLYSAPNASNGNKMSAFLILGENGDRRIIHEARRILKENKGSVDIRMSSMSVLGKQGAPQDIPLLESFLEANDSRLRKAANLNLKSLRKRLEKESSNTQ